MKRRLALFGLLLPLAAWLAYALLGHTVAQHLALRWGPQLVKAGDGKFVDAAVFLQHRFCELAWLVTWAVVIVGAGVGLGALAARRLSRLWQWVPYALAGFAGLNLWLKLAMGTCLFWCLLWNGKEHTDNLTQFHIKLLLMNENPAPVKAVLGGSSQVRTQIDVRGMNRQLGSNLYTTELHFPGNHGYDYLFLARKLQGHKADIMVCYLSEINFFSKRLSDGFSSFFGFADLPEFVRLGGWKFWTLETCGYGLLGDLLPVFRLRDSVANRVLGNDLVGVGQRQHPASPEADFRARTRLAAEGYGDSAETRFEMAAFEYFVAECRARQQTVVLCHGQLNPLLEEQIRPSLQPQLLAFLRELAAKYDNVVLLERQCFPPQTSQDYEDLTHVLPEAQARFTATLAPKLEAVAQQRRETKF